MENAQAFSLSRERCMNALEYQVILEISWHIETQ